MDKVSKEKRSEIMRKVRSKETSLELLFRKHLWSQGIRYSKNNLTVFGRPDLMMKGKKIVIFIDSCFWHGCKKHLRMPNSNKDYWVKKINRNIERDKQVSHYYLNYHWKILRIWEHSLINKEKVISKIKSLID